MKELQEEMERLQIDAYDDISMDVDAWIGFESLKSHAYNNI
jgi:hypothetical protein